MKLRLLEETSAIRCVQLWIAGNAWLIVAVLWLIAIATMYGILAMDPPPTGSLIDRLTTNFLGNLLAGLIVSVLFLFLGLQFGNRTSQAILKSEEILSELKDLRDIERKINAFKSFMEQEKWHNVQFPRIKGKNGYALNYTIEPVRDQSGQPMIKKTEIRSLYLIRVRPIRALFHDDSKMVNYETSPIREGEYYFCQFLNSSWHMCDSTYSEWHEFFLSGKVGEIERGLSANAWMKQFSLPISAKPVVTLNNVLTFRQIVVFQDQKALHVQCDDSPLKALYYRNRKGDMPNQGFFFHIENLGGYGSFHQIRELEKTIEEALVAANVTIPQIPFYHLPS